MFNGGVSPMAFTIISAIVSLALLVPGLAAGVRRLHDVGKGGGWIFIAFVPIVGWVWIIWLLATKGEPAPNRFG